MANDQMKPIATLLLGLNFCMYVIVLGIGGWAMNRAIDHGFVIGKVSNLSLVPSILCNFSIEKKCFLLSK